MNGRTWKHLQGDGRMSKIKRSKKSIESNTGNKFTRLYVNFDSFENMTEHDLVPRKTPTPQYSEKLLKSVGNATVPVKKSLERAKMFK